MSAGGERIHPARMKALYLLAASLFFVSVSCERHSWEETKKLHEEHGHAEHAEGEAHGTAAHGEESPAGEEHATDEEEGH